MKPPPSPRAQRVWLLLLALFCGGQIWHTSRGASRWPFATYDMFSQRIGEEDTVYRVVLYRADGQRMEVDPGQVLPVEFFRAAGMLGEIYDTESPDPRQEAFARSILTRLNQSPWRPFDEVFAAATAPVPFVGLDVVRADVSLAGPGEPRATYSTVLFHHGPT